MADKLNLGCGGDLRGGWINADKSPWTEDVITFNFDNEKLVDKFGKNRFDEVLIKGCIIEFAKNPIEVFSELYDVCVDGATIRVVTAVVDHSLGIFRDPTAKRYLMSEWAHYIAGSRVNGGRGLGLRGEFEVVSNDIGTEVQDITFRVRKPYNTDELEAKLRG